MAVEKNFHIVTTPVLVAVRRALVNVPSQAFFILPIKFGLKMKISFWQYKKKAPDAPLHFFAYSNFIISITVLNRQKNALG